MAASVTAQWIGAPELHHTLHGMQERYLAPEGNFPATIQLLEQNERDVFDGLHGRYVNTGATRDSLTSSGGDAIRDIRGDELEFGTAVYYARFLTRVIGPDNRRTGGSAVLRVSPARRTMIAGQTLNWLVNGSQSMLAMFAEGA
jgi:hypothetical protein